MALTSAPWCSLPALETLEVCGALVSKEFLRQVLAGLLRLKDLTWIVHYEPRLDAQDAGAPIGPVTAARLTRIECVPLDSQARCALQSTAFPVLRFFQGDEDYEVDDEAEDMDHSLALFPRMCRSSPTLTSLYLRLCPSHHLVRSSNVSAGLAMLTSLESLRLICMKPENGASQESTFVGVQSLAGLTRLTSVWVEGVLDPRSFDRDVEAMAVLKALRELGLCEKVFLTVDKHVPRPEDSLITSDDVASLRAALPKLRRFVVMGGWVDLGRPGWANSRVTPQGQIVVQSMPWSPQPPKWGQDDELEDVRMFFARDYSVEWLILDALKAVHV